MKRSFGFVILALAVLMFVPRIAAQTPIQDISPQATPYALSPPPAGNNWLLSSWYCTPADCFDYVVGQTGVSYTAAYGTCYGIPTSLWPAHNPAAAMEIIAYNCADVVFMETGTATFRFTTKKINSSAGLKSFGLEGLIVPAQETQNNVVIAVGYDLEWCDGTFSDTNPVENPC